MSGNASKNQPAKKKISLLPFFLSMAKKNTRNMATELIIFSLAMMYEKGCNTEKDTYTILCIVKL